MGIPPISGGSDLRPILDLIYDGRILEGPEIQDVATELRVCMDVLDWRDALFAVNKEEEEEENDSNHNHEHDVNNEGTTMTTKTTSPIPFVELPKLINGLMIVNVELLRLLTDAFDDADPNMLDGTTFPSLGRLRKSIQSAKIEVLAIVDKLLASPSLRGALAIDGGGSLVMEINGRLVIPVKRHEYYSPTSAALAPPPLLGGIVHDSSQSGNTIYIEPPDIIERTNDPVAWKANYGARRLGYGVR